MKTQNSNTKKPELVFRIEVTGDYPLAGRHEQHTLREWKRIFGYDGLFPCSAKFVKVEQP